MDRKTKILTQGNGHVSKVSSRHKDGLMNTYTEIGGWMDGCVARQKAKQMDGRTKVC